VQDLSTAIGHRDDPLSGPTFSRPVESRGRHASRCSLHDVLDAYPAQTNPRLSAHPRPNGAQHLCPDRLLVPFGARNRRFGGDRPIDGVDHFGQGELLGTAIEVVPAIPSSSCDEDSGPPTTGQQLTGERRREARADGQCGHRRRLSCRVQGQRHDQSTRSVASCTYPHREPCAPICVHEVRLGFGQTPLEQLTMQSLGRLALGQCADTPRLGVLVQIQRIGEPGDQVPRSEGTEVCRFVRACLVASFEAVAQQHHVLAFVS
jgi:hypothetical protein